MPRGLGGRGMTVTAVGTSTASEGGGPGGSKQQVANGHGHPCLEATTDPGQGSDRLYRDRCKRPRTAGRLWDLRVAPDSSAGDPCCSLGVGRSEPFSLLSH